MHELIAYLVLVVTVAATMCGHPARAPGPDPVRATLARLTRKAHR